MMTGEKAYSATPGCMFCHENADFVFETSGSESNSAEYTYACSLHTTQAFDLFGSIQVRGGKKVLCRLLKDEDQPWLLVWWWW